VLRNLGHLFAQASSALDQNLAKELEQLLSADQLRAETISCYIYGICKNILAQVLELVRV